MAITDTKVMLEIEDIKKLYGVIAIIIAMQSNARLQLRFSENQLIDVEIVE